MSLKGGCFRCVSKVCLRGYVCVCVCVGVAGGGSLGVGGWSGRGGGARGGAGWNRTAGKWTSRLSPCSNASYSASLPVHFDGCDIHLTLHCGHSPTQDTHTHTHNCTVPRAAFHTNLASFSQGPVEHAGVTLLTGSTDGGNCCRERGERERERCRGW